ncbi:MAG: DeoR/GlpR family DNA-binding transcription regulator [Comamonas sp.]|uniref:DeoR/GlpR family DNA-binding transcription regulator n=1 Tax=Comamonas sp. TaxID=34028 RepID=UPI002FC85EA4
MIPALRRQKMIDLLKEADFLFLPDLVSAMQISESTVRRDLKDLARNGEIELLRGGGVRIPHKNMEMSINLKLQLHLQEKDAIAKAAARMICAGDIVFLDPSSVNYLLIDHLNAEGITVVTNSITHMAKLLQADIHCIMIGGQIKKSTSSCLGPMAETMLREMCFNKCFLGANGVDRINGITNHDPSEKSIKRIAIEHSASTYFLIDSGKFGQAAMCRVADVDECHILTDHIPDGYEDLPNLMEVPQ